MIVSLSVDWNSPPLLSAQHRANRGNPRIVTSGRVVISGSVGQSAALDKFQHDKGEPTMKRFVMVTTAAVLLSCGSAFAQSPLGIGPGSPVAPTGIPMGTTELASPGVSPTTSGTSPLGLTASTLCSGIGGSIPETSFGLTTSTTGTTSGTEMSSAGTSGSNSVFDGGGTVGTASGTCAATSSSSLAGPATSASSP